ncbi:hypothetical protein E2986_12344 [Frieseomelitta varia]|uniref:Uncharacterized protein n=1 Tax=Frieseomelitta varia TaxID=561572 RepID=A0A833RX37_9HYME|nr:hypothetical protein E2986_12344 [Frieseomelitta varia]
MSSQVASYEFKNGSPIKSSIEGPYATLQLTRCALSRLGSVHGSIAKTFRRIDAMEYVARDTTASSHPTSRYTLEQDYPDNREVIMRTDSSQQCFVMKKMALLITRRVPAGLMHEIGRGISANKMCAPRGRPGAKRLQQEERAAKNEDKGIASTPRGPVGASTISSTHVPLRYAYARAYTFQQKERGAGRGGGAGGTIMDMSEDCWEHVGLLQEVSAAEPPPPPPAPDFLIQQQESVISKVFPKKTDNFGRDSITRRTSRVLCRRSDLSDCLINVVGMMEYSGNGKKLTLQNIELRVGQIISNATLKSAVSWKDAESNVATKQKTGLQKLAVNDRFLKCVLEVQLI